jgi:hypothetical protein
MQAREPHGLGVTSEERKYSKQSGHCGKWVLEGEVASGREETQERCRKED